MVPYTLSTASVIVCTIQNVGSVYSSVKVLRLMRVVRVARTLDHYIEYGAAVLTLLLLLLLDTLVTTRIHHVSTEMYGVNARDVHYGLICVLILFHLVRALLQSTKYQQRHAELTAKTYRVNNKSTVYQLTEAYIGLTMIVLILLVFMFVLIAHWLACVWYTIGDHELTGAVQFGWLSTLLCDTSLAPDCSDNPTTLQLLDHTRRHEAGATVTTVPGLSVAMSYLTALYYTLSCITSVGFGNVSATTQYEKIFSICVMILGGMYCYCSCLLSQFIHSPSL